MQSEPGAQGSVREGGRGGGREGGREEGKRGRLREILQSDTMATNYFITPFAAVIIRGWRLFEGDIYYTGQFASYKVMHRRYFQYVSWLPSITLHA